MANPSSPTTDTPIGTPLGDTAAKSALIVKREVYHEFGTELEDRVEETTVDIDPESPPAKVEFKSHVLFSGKRALRSPAYLATVRRRGAAKIARLVTELDKHVDSDDFAVWTHEALQELRKLIQTLSDAEQDADPKHEGNSCEILRQLRDTLLNTGWQRYRENQVRRSVVDILNHLAKANQDDVTPEHADRAMDKLLDLNLDPTVGFPWQHGEEEIPD